VDQHGIVERLAQWVLCAGSLVLWLMLDADLLNALWWAAKAPGHHLMGGAVRMDKVALCLAWSFSIFLFYAYHYRMGGRAIFTLLVSVLLVQLVAAAVNVFIIPYIYLVTQYLLLAIMLLIAPLLVSMVLAYMVLARRTFAQTHVRIVSAITLGACATMAWVGLFDAAYLGIVRR
jgi:hypothetical protein